MIYLYIPSISITHVISHTHKRIYEFPNNKQNRQVAQTERPIVRNYVKRFNFE